jgi:hypothetical protein
MIGIDPDEAGGFSAADISFCDHSPGSLSVPSLLVNLVAGITSGPQRAAALPAAAAG